MPRKKHPTWTHPELGEFVYDSWWTAEFRMPAFACFRIRGEPKRAKHSKVNIQIGTYAETVFPSPAAVRLALRIIENEQMLVEKLLRAVWRDLKGIGRDSERVLKFSFRCLRAFVT